MKMADIQSKAKAMGIKPGKMKKAELIRTIQTTEGNFSCFQTSDNAQCTQESCCWRDDCIVE
jgi:hypothetical protein